MNINKSIDSIVKTKKAPSFLLPRKSLVVVAVISVFSLLIFGFWYTFQSIALNPPTQNPPTGGGAIGVASDAPANSLYMSSAGNVGIGTTAPAQKLHVEGQCITGDSLLSVIPAEKIESGRALKAPEALKALKALEEKIAIKDIISDYYVYSLNTETGKVEPAKVKALLDMGVKPVFRLTTESGKQIRTTGNHPYLAIQNYEQQPAIQLRTTQGLAREYGLDPESLSKDSEIPQGGAIWVDFSNEEISSFSSSQYCRGQGNVVSESLCGISLSSQRQSLRDSNLSEIGSQTQLLGRIRNQRTSSAGLSYSEPIKSTSEVSQGAEINKKSTNEMADFSGVSNVVQNSGLSPYNQYSKSKTLVKGLAVDNQKALEVEGVEPSDSWVTNRSPRHATPRATSLYQEKLQQAKWTKVIELSEGDYIAVSPLEHLEHLEPYEQVLWEKIISIEYVGYEQVYDIAVEGNYNFIANDIFAHNTYISGNVGIGTTEPGAKLHVAGYIKSSNANVALKATNSASQDVPANTFTRLNIDSVTYDPSGGFDTTNRWYTIPVTGYYIVVARVRLPSGQTAGIDTGIGVNTAENDGTPQFSWQEYQSGRTSIDIVRVDKFNAGDQIRAYVYFDSAMTIGAGAMYLAIQLISI